MKYAIREGLVCRDIAGIYFLIDIRDRHFYKNKQVNCLNPTAYLMLSSMNERQVFSVDDILVDVIAALDPSCDVPRERIASDIEKLLEAAIAKGWVNYAER